ncbi:MAG: hypothetical protein RI885_1020 [Actinomycetota bacterium]|jgi:pilus assembly protein CpaF
MIADPTTSPGSAPARFVAVPPARLAHADPPALAATSAPDTFDEFGPLAPFLGDDDVTDLFVNGDRLFVDRGGGIRPDTTVRFTAAESRALAVRLIAAGGRHIDEATPCVDVRVRDGIRIHAVLPPVSSTGTLLSIRLPRRSRLTIDALESQGFFGRVPVGVVTRLVGERRNVLVTGAGGSGKTTLLGAMLAVAPPGERIVAIEDVAELRVAHPHFVSLEARQANLEGAGAVSMASLVREALRMRPDRLVLGECRGAEVREMLSALNTGHDGGAGTLHANSLDDVPARLEALGALAGLDPTAIARQAVSAIHAVLHVERHEGGRRLATIGALGLDGRDRLVIADSSSATGQTRRGALPGVTDAVGGIRRADGGHGRHG